MPLPVRALLERLRRPMSWTLTFDHDAMQHLNKYYTRLILHFLLGCSIVLLIVVFTVDTEFLSLAKVIVSVAAAYFLLLRLLCTRLSPTLLAWLTLWGMYAAILLIYYATPHLHPAQTLSLFVLVTYISGQLLTRYGLGVITVLVTVTMLALWALGHPTYSLLSTTLFVILSSLMIWLATLMQQSALEQLMASETRYRELMEATTEPIIISSEDGKILDCNKAFEELMGYPIEQVRGEYMLGYVVPEQRRQAARHWFARKSTPCDVQVLRRDGQVLDVEFATRPHSYRGAPAFVTALRDMTLRRRIEETRRENELRYKALFETMNDAVFIIGLDNHVIISNEQGMRLTGYSLEEMRQMTFMDIVVEEEIPHAIEVNERLRRGEHLPPYLRCFRRKDGTIAKAEISAMLVRDHDGKPLYLQSICRDVTERERLTEERFIAALQNERMALLRQLIDEFSHYIRTPLTTIKNAHYLLTRTSDTERRTRYLEMINREADRITNLLNDLLLLVRVDVQFEQRETLDVNGLVKMLLPAPLGMKSPDDQHEFTFEAAADCPSVYGNRSALMEAISRLIDNAQLYTPAGGKIYVSVRCEGQTVLISVQDEGIGIAADALPYIFDNFYRTDAARSIASSSSGLGLSIALRIAKLHNGTLSVESEEGKGSTFTLTLPCVSASSKV